MNDPSPPPIDRLIRQIQRAAPGSIERQQSIAQLIEAARLPQRKIVRPPRGQPLTGIYLETLEAVQVHWQQLIDRDIDRYFLGRTTTPDQDAQDWLQGLLSQTCKTLLDESRLQQFALAVQSHQPRSPGWQYAIHQLVNAIRLSGKLARLSHLSRDTYEDVVNRTFLWICQHIHAYNRQRGSFISWVNYRLSMIAREIQQETKDSYTQAVQSKVIRTKYQLSSLLKQTAVTDLHNWLGLFLKELLPNASVGLNGIRILAVMLCLAHQIHHNPAIENDLLFDLAQLCVASPPKLVQIEETQAVETIAQPETEPSLAEELRRYIEQDPEGLCQKSMRSHPAITFQKVALARLNGHSWQEISQRFGVKIPTLSNFFQRALQEIAPKIRRAMTDGF